MFDRDVPLPAPKSRWDFAQAEPGCSLKFDNQKLAAQFARAVRAAGRGWGTVSAPEGNGVRVWIVAGKTAPKISIHTTYTRPPRPMPPFISLSTETDDDLGLRVDLRRGEAVTLEKLPEARPVEVDEEPKQGAPSRRRQRAA